MNFSLIPPLVICVPRTAYSRVFCSLYYLDIPQLDSDLSGRSFHISTASVPVQMEIHPCKQSQYLNQFCNIDAFFENVAPATCPGRVAELLVPPAYNKYIVMLILFLFLWRAQNNIVFAIAVGHWIGQCREWKEAFWFCGKKKCSTVMLCFHITW